MCRACFDSEGHLAQATIHDCAVYMNCTYGRCGHSSHKPEEPPKLHGEVWDHMCDCGWCFCKISKEARALEPRRF